MEMNGNNHNHYLKSELYDLIKSDSAIFDFLQAGSLDGIWYWDLENPEIEWMSPKFWELFGHDPKTKKHLAAEWKDMIFNEDLELAIDNFKKHCENPDHPYDQIVRYRHQDGSTVWVRCRGIAIRNKDGKPIRMLGAHTDLTQLKRTELAIALSEEKYRSLFVNNHDAIFLFNPENYKIVEANQATCNLYGYTEDELIGMSCLDLSEERDKSVDTIQAVGRIGVVHVNHRMHRRKDKSVFPVMVTGHKARIEQQEMIYSVVRDISELDAINKKLDIERKTTENYLNTANIFVVVLGRSAEIHFLNDKACQILGCNKGEFIGRNWFDHFVPTENIEQVKGVFREIIAGNITFVENYSNAIRTLQGDERMIDWHNNPILDKEGKIVEILSTGIDITDRIKSEQEKIRLEDQLAQSQKMEAIGTLAGGIAHDFNNLLGVILGYADLSMEDPALTDDIRETFESIIKASERAKDLVAQILTFSRKSDQTMGPVDLNELIDETRLFMRSTIPTTIAIDYDIQTRNATVFGNSTQLTQILLNLCTNAAHAMREDGGILTITLKQIEIDPEQAKQYQISSTNNLMLGINDTGIGIPAEHQKRIFEPYFTTKKEGEGTGMGLAVVYGIVKNHGGHVKVYSEPGRGTSIMVFLPTTKVEMKDNEKSERMSFSGHGRRVLFVDDEPELAMLGQKILKSMGFNTDILNDSQKALDRIRENPQQYDLIITDLTMPNMTGTQMSECIRKKDIEIPIILCTGFSNGICREDIHNSGIDGFLMKPIIKSDLIDVIKTVLD